MMMRPRAAGITMKATPRATPSPVGMMQRRVRRAGVAMESMPSHTQSPVGTTVEPKWDRVAGEMMERSR